MDRHLSAKNRAIRAFGIARHHRKPFHFELLSPPFGDKTQRLHRASRPLLELTVVYLGCHNRFFRRKRDFSGGGGGAPAARADHSSFPRRRFLQRLAQGRGLLRMTHPETPPLRGSQTLSCYGFSVGSQTENSQNSTVNRYTSSAGS